MTEVQFLNDCFTNFRLDAINKQDADLGDIQSRSLEQISPYVIKRKLPVTGFDDLCLTKYDLVLGKTEYTHLFQDSMGVPDVTFGTSDNVSEVDVSFTSEKIPIFSTRLGLSVTQDEIYAVKAGAYGEYGNDLLRVKTEAVMRGLDEKATQLGLYGIPNRGISGLLTDSNVLTEAATFNFYTETEATTLASRFLEYFFYVYENTNGVEKIDTILVPLKLKTKFSLTYIANDGKNAMTLINDVLREYGVEMKARRELRGSDLRQAGVLPSNSTLDMMIFYNRKATPGYNVSVERHGTNYYSYPWVYTNEFRYRTVLRQSFTGVKFLYAGSAVRVTFAEP